MSRTDLEKTAKTLIDIVLNSRKTIEVKKHVETKKERDPNSASEKFKKDSDVWPEEVAKKFPLAFLHAVGDYVYARTIEFGTKETRDKPVSHYVWSLYSGSFPTKGRRFQHVNGNTRNNNYSNLHPLDGVYK